MPTIKERQLQTLSQRRHARTLHTGRLSCSGPNLQSIPRMDPARPDGEVTVWSAGAGVQSTDIVMNIVSTPVRAGKTYAMRMFLEKERAGAGVDVLFRGPL